MDVKSLIQSSINLAIQTKSTHVTPIHLIYELIKYPDINQILSTYGMNDVAALSKTIKQTLVKNKSKLPVISPEFSYKLEYIIKHAVTGSLLNSKSSPSGLDILISILQTDEVIKEIFQFSNIDVNSIIAQAVEPVSTPKKIKEDKVFTPSKYLEKFTKNFNLLARDDKFVPFIGREEEIKDIFHSLIRKTKNSVLLVGDPGVGKSAIIEGLAIHITNKSDLVPEKLLDTQIFSLDISDLIAGAKHHGTFEERISGIFDELSKIPNSVLCINDIQNIIGNGGGGSLDLAAVIKTAISNDNLKVIGTVSTEEYRKHLDKDRNLLRRFNKIDILEPSNEETLSILHGITPTLEEFYECKIDDGAILSVVELSKKYMFDKHFPDKAIDLLDSTFATSHLSGDDYTITQTDVLREVSKFTKISEVEMNETEKSKLLGLRDKLESKIYGQKQAIDKLVDVIHVSKTGLRASNKTVSNLLFRGVTSSGKTYTAKILAKTLGVDLLRFDLSAYQEKFSLSVLIGSPPGYLGYSDGRAGDGLLINAIEKSPNGVILFDEVEKAHPDVLNVLLQMMDYGVLTSSSGKVVSCRNNIIILTSNIGSESEEKQRIGFLTIDNSDKFEEAYTGFFRPEFRARLDAVIKFNKLGETELKQVILTIFDETVTLLQKQRITLFMPDNLLNYLIKKCLNSPSGARVVNVLIDELIKPKLANIIINKDEHTDLIITVDYIDGQIQIIPQITIDKN